MNLTQFQLSYELSPIVLVNGIAQDVPDGKLPIISLLQAQDFNQGLLSGSSDISYSDFIAHFNPLPSGSTLIDNSVATYPFANQQVAANAIIVQPLRVSLMMIAPAQDNGGYSSKLATFTSVQNALAQHSIQGGTYIVATPAFLWTNLLLLTLKDVTLQGETKQAQVRWQWDFFQPLITLEQAQAAQNSLMSKISSGAQVTGNPPAQSGAGNTVGQPASGVAPGVIPAAQPLAGASVPAAGGAAGGYSRSGGYFAAGSSGSPSNTPVGYFNPNASG